jgi:EmrB/QacA subfamily drug resistance transporter
VLVENRRVTAVVGVLSLAVFMSSLDLFIVNLAFPYISRQYPGTSLSSLSWVLNAYTIVFAAVLVPAGRWADRIGRRRLFTAGLALFSFGSVLCGLAPGVAALIAARVIQAAGAGAMVPASLSLLLAAVPAAVRPKALGTWSALGALGAALGPVIGGALVQVDWRWVFWINVPFGLVGTVIGWFVLPPTRDLPDDDRFDWRGALLIAPALTALVAMLNEGYAWGATSPLFLGCGVLAVVLLMLFVRSERRAAAPLIDLTLFRSAAFSAGNGAGLLAYAALFGLFFLMPFVFVRVYQDSILAAGLRLSIVPVMLGIVAPLAGALYDRLGARALTASGMLVCVGALVLLFAVMDGTPASASPVMLALAVFGVGQGLFISPNNSAIVAAAPTTLTGEAGGLLNVTRSLGISIGVAAASSLLAWRLAVLTGGGHSTLHAGARDLLSASRDVIVLLGAFAAVAGALSLTRTSSVPPGGAKDRLG